MNPIILFRESLGFNDEEALVAKNYFTVVNQRTLCKDSLVIGRYSVLPFYKELEQDLINNGCQLINTYEQHKYIADFHYYHDIQEYTPKTWFGDQWPDMPEGQYVVKGKTNSRKFEWDTRMFAPTKQRAIQIACDLMGDLLIGPQDIIIRKYEPLEKIGEGLNGLPFSNEWRAFFYRNQLLSIGYYWSISEKVGELDNVGAQFACDMAKIISKKTNFFVIDIAKTTAGEWMVVELNDGQMSGLSLNKPELLYYNLKLILES